MDALKLILAALASAVVLFLITKILGHKQVAHLDFFDYITGITIGSIAAEMATDLEAPWKPLLAMVVYGAVSLILSILTGKFPRLRKYINGTPTIILNDGKLYRKNMKKARLDLSELLVMCRQEGFFDLNEIKTAIFEYNGHLTILPKAEKRPVNPSDLSLAPEAQSIQTELIMDGRILGENLHRMGLDETWLNTQLKAQGYKHAKEILLAVCDQSHTLTLFAVR